MGGEKLNRCACGAEPKMRAVQVAEDAVETWVDCMCGRETERIEDAYADRPTAAWIWNKGAIIQPRASDHG